MATPQAFKDYIVRFRRGDRVYSTGDPGTEMYIVQSGSVEIFRESNGGRVRLTVMERGDFFGEMALIESAPHSTCAEALEESELIEINSTLFDKMIKGNIEIAVRMLRKLSIRLRDATRRLEEMAAASVPAQPPALAVQAPAVPSPSPVEATPEPQAAPAAPAAPRAPVMPSPVAPDPPAAGATHAPPTTAAGQRPKDCHAVLLAEDGRELFHLTTSRAAIGRFDPVTGLKPEVDLSALDLNRSVSRHHARLTQEGGVYSVAEEVGALNGTFINGKKLVSGKPSRIRDGDILSLGMVKLIFKEVLVGAG